MNNRLQVHTEEMMGLSTINPSQSETNSGASNHHFIESINHIPSHTKGQFFNPNAYGFNNLR